MGFQSTLNEDQGFGVIGEFAFDGPRRVEPINIVSADAANNVIGRAFFYTDPGVAVAQAGGADLVFAGILGMPKEYASRGTTAGGTLAATLTLANNEIGQFVQMGEIVVALPAAADIGDVVYSTDADGVLVTTAPGALAPADSTLVPNATVRRYVADGAGAQLAVIRLTN